MLLAWVLYKMSGHCPMLLDVKQYMERGDYKTAGWYLEFLYGPCKFRNLPELNHYMVEYYYAVGDEEKHLFHLDKTMKLYNKINDPYGQGRAHIYLIKARDQVGKDTTKVIEYCEKGLEISLHEPINIALHYWLYEVYDETGEYGLSKEHKEKYEEICRDNEPYLYQTGDGDFFHIHDDARKARIPYEEWTQMSDKEQGKALLKVGKYY